MLGAKFFQVNTTTHTFQKLNKHTEARKSHLVFSKFEFGLSLTMHKIEVLMHACGKVIYLKSLFRLAMVFQSLPKDGLV